MALWVSLTLPFIFFTKSAQLPFSSWLINAISAPTPVPSPLHSPTMVIAGVYLGLMINSSLHVIIDSFFPIYIVAIVAIMATLIWSLFKALSLSNIKSIIAFSTINQISYMFIALLLFPLVCLFHIVVHALFKSLLSLLAGSIIHVQSNFQSIYKLRINFSSSSYTASHSLATLRSVINDPD